MVSARDPRDHRARRTRRGETDCAAARPLRATDCATDRARVSSPRPRARDARRRRFGAGGGVVRLFRARRQRPARARGRTIPRMSPPPSTRGAPPRSTRRRRPCGALTRGFVRATPLALRSRWRARATCARAAEDGDKSAGAAYARIFISYPRSRRGENRRKRGRMRRTHSCIFEILFAYGQTFRRLENVRTRRVIVLSYRAFGGLGQSAPPASYLFRSEETRKVRARRECTASARAPGTRARTRSLTLSPRERSIAIATRGNGLARCKCKLLMAGVSRARAARISLDFNRAYINPLRDVSVETLRAGATRERRRDEAFAPDARALDRRDGIRRPRRGVRARRPTARAIDFAGLGIDLPSRLPDATIN